MTNTSPLDRSPAVGRPRFECPHCDAFAHQAWAPLVVPGDEDPWEYLDFYHEHPDEESSLMGGRTHIVSRWQCAQCQSCEDWSLWFNDAMIYPHARTGPAPHPEMPQSVRLLYQEAAAVAIASLRAGAAMARTVVERLIKEIDNDAPPRANLETRIARLRPRVSTPLAQLLDVVRVTGNGALHSDDSDIVAFALDDHEGPAAFALLLQAANGLVDELITRPRVTSELWNMLPQTIRDRSQNAAP